MCFSLPRLAATIGLGVLGGEGLSSRGAGGEHWESSGWSDSSETTESTLDESAGMSFFFGLGLGSLIAGVVDFRGWVSQHMVSRPHIRQLRFSSLRPSSTVSAHLEKTLHMPYRFSTFLVSTLRIFPASTDSIGISSRTGMVDEMCLESQDRLRYQVEVGGWFIGDEKRQAGMCSEAEVCWKMEGTLLVLPELTRAHKRVWWWVVEW